MQKDLSQIIWGVIIVSCFFVLVSAFIVFYILLYKKRQAKSIEEKKAMQQSFSQQLLQSRIETQEETMSVLGKELHDNVGQLLSSTKMMLGIMERGMEQPPDILLSASYTLGKAIYELRSLSKSLNKEWLDQFSLIENLTAEAARINSSGLVAISFVHPPSLMLEADRQLILFRIVQEAIQNALKHAQAGSIHIHAAINSEHTELAITITDDGAGFKPAHASDGIGIINIKQRTKLLGGTVDWQSGTHGTTIAIQLPITKAEQ